MNINNVQVQCVCGHWSNLDECLLFKSRRVACEKCEKLICGVRLVERTTTPGEVVGAAEGLSLEEAPRS